MTKSPVSGYRRAIALAAILLGTWLGNPCPSMAQTPGSLDGSFFPGSGANGSVTSIVPQPDGKILIGGQFTAVDGVARNRIARLNADGSLDQGFNPGAGADASIEAVVLQRDGKIIVGGHFDSFDGVVRNQIARLNPDGSLDRPFAPSSSWVNFVATLAVQSDGKVLVSGPFSVFNGEPRSYLVRLNPDGSVDTGFAPIGDNWLEAIAFQSDGKIVIAGDFRTVNGVSRRLGVARLNLDGSLDPSFIPGGDIAPTINVRSVAVQTDGKILIGGDFSFINGVRRRSVARLHADGSLDSGFVPDGPARSLVWAVAAQTDNKPIVGGTFLIGFGSGPFYFARLNADGSPDSSFDPGSGPGGSAIGSVHAIVIQCDGRILLGGSFSTVNDVPRDRIARLHGDAPACRPDLAIRNSDETASIGDNIYNPTGTDQAKSQSVSPGMTATYVVTVQNDGTAPEPITLTGPAGGAGWVVRYFDAPTGGGDITTAVTGSGWLVGLGPGAAREFRVELTAAATLVDGQQQTVVVTATAVGGGVRQDAVAATATVVARRPDLLIRNAYDTPVAGNDVYNDTGDNQRQSTAVAPGLSAAFVATLQNDATAADAFTLTGPAGSAGWAINYFDAAEGGSDITAQVTGAGWRTSSLAPGAALEIRVELSPAASLPGGQQIDVRVTAASTGDPAARDTVLASARTPLPLRPDIMIRLGSEAEFFFAGSNIYNVTGQNQARIQAVSTGTTAAYVIALQNDADRPDRFRITGLAGRSGWTVRYFDAAGGGTDVTGPVTAAGWMSSVLAPGASIRLRVEVIAGSTVALGAQADLRIMAASAGDPARQDVVLASTRLSSLRGNTLIADAFNHRVIEVDAAKTIVWQYGTGVRGTGPNQLQGPYRARRLAGGNTLIVDFDGHRVIEVTRDGTIAWQFGKSDIAQPHLWAYPDYAERLANGNTLISSRGEGAGSFGDNTIYHRLIEVAPDKSIVWRYDYIAPTSARPDPRPILPTSAVRLAQGKTLIMDARYGTALEVAANKKTLWYYGELNQLRVPNMAIRLSNGNTLITDLYDYRVIEVNIAKTIVWQYGRTQVAGWGPNQLYAPHSAVRLANGNTLIAHGYDRVI